MDLRKPVVGPKNIEEKNQLKKSNDRKIQVKGPLIDHEIGDQSRAGFQYKNKTLKNCESTA